MLLWMMFIITAMYGNSEKNEASGAHKLGDSPQATTYKATLAGYQGTFSNVDLSAYHGQEMQLTGVSCVKLDTGHAPNPFIVKNTSGDKYIKVWVYNLVA